jgi:hypothetical protein
MPEEKGENETDAAAHPPVEHRSMIVNEHGA